MEQKIRMKALRLSNRLKQSEMAEIIGVTQSVVSRMELPPSWKVSEPQFDALCERFGREMVENYIDGGASVVVAGNTNRGDGQQNIMQDPESLNVIRQLTESVTELARKQSEQTDRLLSILERLTNQ